MDRTFVAFLVLVVALATTGSAFADPEEATDGDAPVEELAPDLEAIAMKHEAAMAARAERLQRKLPSAEGDSAPQSFSVSPANGLDLLYATHPKAIE